MANSKDPGEMPHDVVYRGLYRHPLRGAQLLLEWQMGIQRGGGGQGVRTPPGKSQVIWVSIRNKQLDPPGKSWTSLENVGPPLEP